MTASVGDRYATEKRYRVRRDRYGRLWQDATPYRERLLAWRAAGWSYPAIAQAVGVDVFTIQRISGNNATHTSTWVFRETAAAIDGADFTRCHGRVMVPVAGSRRRLRALAAIGWTRRAIAAESGIPYGTLCTVTYEAVQTTADTRNRICAAYERLSAIPQHGPGADRVRRTAARNRWAPPAAWDDIDDPDETPQGVRTGPDRTTHSADMVVDACETIGSIDKAAARLGTSRESVRKALARAGRHDLWDRLWTAEQAGAAA